jgi:hypothetical protein
MTSPPLFKSRFWRLDAMSLYAPEALKEVVG